VCVCVCVCVCVSSSACVCVVSPYRLCLSRFSVARTRTLSLCHARCLYVARAISLSIACTRTLSVPLPLSLSAHCSPSGARSRTRLDSGVPASLFPFSFLALLLILVIPSCSHTRACTPPPHRFRFSNGRGAVGSSIPAPSMNTRVNSPLSPRTRAQLVERLESHTRLCVCCNTALQRAETLRTWACAAVLCALVAGVRTYKDFICINTNFPVDVTITIHTHACLVCSFLKYLDNHRALTWPRFSQTRNVCFSTSVRSSSLG